MQGHATEAFVTLPHLLGMLWVAIARIADQRVALAGRVLPDLMRAAGPECEVDEGEVAVVCDGGVLRDRVYARSGDAARVAPTLGLGAQTLRPPPALFAQLPLDYAPVHLGSLSQALRGLSRPLSRREQHHARSLSIEAVAGVHVGMARRAQGVDQAALTVVHADPCRFVGHQPAIALCKDKLVLWSTHGDLGRRLRQPCGEQEQRRGVMQQHGVPLRVCSVDARVLSALMKSRVPRAELERPHT